MKNIFLFLMSFILLASSISINFVDTETEKGVTVTCSDTLPNDAVCVIALSNEEDTVMEIASKIVSKGNKSTYSTFNIISGRRTTACFLDDDFVPMFSTVYKDYNRTIPEPPIITLAASGVCTFCIRNSVIGNEYILFAVNGTYDTLPSPSECTFTYMTAVTASSKAIVFPKTYIKQKTTFIITGANITPYIIGTYDIASGKATNIIDETLYFESTTTVSALKGLFAEEITVKSESGNILSDDNIVGTGAVISYSGKETTVSIKNDTDGNGKIENTDYLYLKMGLRGTVSLTKSSQIAADSNLDGSITVTDYLRLKHYLRRTK